MSEWITDRRPTAEDADTAGCVWASTESMSRYTHWKSVEENEAWAKTNRPEMYVPPIDASLAASIERIKRKFARGMACVDKPCDCCICDMERIIEAARKWDAL